jgi:DNA-directed RNA polymerase specialized sigma24 family protein
MREMLEDASRQAVHAETLKAAAVDAQVPGTNAAVGQPGGCADSVDLEAEVRELFQTAALLVGDETAALELVEQSVAAVEMDPCAEGEAARASYGRELLERTLGRVASLYPRQMQPAAAAELGGCVETDELEAAGITRHQLEEMLSGSSRRRMRQWLEGLGPVERVVFVLRAVLGRSSADSASLLSGSTGAAWDTAHIGGAYRSALCSLASAMVQSAAH